MPPLAHFRVPCSLLLPLPPLGIPPSIPFRYPLLPISQHIVSVPQTSTRALFPGRLFFTYHCRQHSFLTTLLHSLYPYFLAAGSKHLPRRNSRPTITYSDFPLRKHPTSILLTPFKLHFSDVSCFPELVASGYSNCQSSVLKTTSSQFHHRTAGTRDKATSRKGLDPTCLTEHSIPFSYFRTAGLQSVDSTGFGFIHSANRTDSYCTGTYGRFKVYSAESHSRLSKQQRDGDLD